MHCPREMPKFALTRNGSRLGSGGPYKGLRSAAHDVGLVGAGCRGRQRDSGFGGGGGKK